MLLTQQDTVGADNHLLFNQIRTFDLFEVDTTQFTNKSPKDAFLKYSYYRLIGEQTKQIDISFDKSLNLTFPQSVYYDLLKGDRNLEENKTKKSDSISYNYYLKAYDLATINDDTILRCEALKKILKYHFKAQEDVLAFHSFAIVYRDIAYDLNEKLCADYFYLGSVIGILYDFKRNDLNPLPEAMSALLQAENGNQHYWVGRLSQLIGVYHDIILHDLKTADIYYNKALNYYDKIPHYYAQKNRYDLGFNLGALEIERGNYNEALSYFENINEKSIQLRDSKDLVLIYQGIYESYLALQQKDSALVYLQKKSSLNDSLQLIQRAKDVKEIQIKYDTDKKELENLQLKERNEIVIISSILILIFGGFGGVLIHQNTTKRRKLAEKEAQLEQQKVATLLKEQELMSIDAMIEGQEKERQKVANELHDDLGSLMATVKLHFDNVKVDQKDPALKNAQKLLDEAYQKIRGMAHAKNSGVMANQGLLPAVKKMARTINETNALEVVVEDFGLADRMENSLELTIFRMLQELITNIIKHAGASKATIQFTQHEDSLNIIVEDNGKGFDMSAAKRKAAGMGLGTIEKRIEHLEGSFTVDSVIGKGTSILIDIPI